MIAPERGDRSFATLISELTRETATLFRQEMRLARAELGEKVGLARAGLIEVVIGGMLLLLAAQALVAAAIVALALAVQWWLAALVIGLVALAAGALVLWRGISNLRTDTLAPRRTLTTLRENTDWARGQMR